MKFIIRGYVHYIPDMVIELSNGRAFILEPFTGHTIYSITEDSFAEYEKSVRLAGTQCRIFNKDK